MKNTRLLSLLLVVTTLTSPLPCLSQQAGNRPELSGEIQIDTAEEADKSSYPVVQKNVIQFFRHMDAQVAQLGTSGTAHVPVLAEAEYQYLTAVYLYCAVQQGVCQQVLDTLLEVDVIKSRLSKSPDCQTLTTFWRLWLKNDMERRQQYLVKTAFLNETEKFRINERNGYINCKPTVTKEISSTLSDRDFFADRYQAQSVKSGLFKRTALLLDGIKNKVPNLYQALGIQFAAKDSGLKGSAEDTKKRKKK